MLVHHFTRDLEADVPASCRFAHWYSCYFQLANVPVPFSVPRAQFPVFFRSEEMPERGLKRPAFSFHVASGRLLLSESRTRLRKQPPPGENNRDTLRGSLNAAFILPAFHYVTRSALSPVIRKRDKTCLSVRGASTVLFYVAGPRGWFFWVVKVGGCPRELLIFAFLHY